MSGDDMPELVWQHQYHQTRWSTYAEKQNRILNKAANKWQKSVSLPCNDPKQTIVAHLDSMIQVNKISSIEQNLRCLVYSDAFYAWMWEDDDGNWTSYKPRLVCFLEMAYQRKENIFSFFDDGDDYYVDFQTFLQKNETSNFTRNVMREKVTDITSGMFNLANRETKFKHMCSDPSLSLKKRCINLPSYSTLSLSMSANTSQQIDIPSLEIDDESEEEECDSVLPVDAECPETKVYHIYQEDATYSAILSYISISENKNKFHVIQLLEHNKKKSFSVWQRYGRVGTKGQNELLNFNTSVMKAKTAFFEKFYEKTGNLWQNRKNFTHVAGKYDLLKIDPNPQSDFVVGEIDLEPSIQSLLELICNKKVMSMIMKEMCYDSANVPLGQLTFRQIKDGYRALNKIAEALKSESAGSDLVNACEEFYMKIPHNFGKKSPPIIQSKEDVEKKLEMLKALTNIRIAMKVLNRGVHEHPLQKCYNSFKYSLQMLDPLGEEFSVLKNCLIQTHGHTHNYTMEVIDIYSCRMKANSTFRNYGNNLLLWHGSRITNWVGILKNGLKIAPTEAPSTGDAYGKGLYFADISSKSANYCYPTKRNNEGLLLLCEVSLGNQLGVLESDESLHYSLPADYNSVFGKGKFAPKSFKFGVLSPDAKMPCGPLVEDTTLHQEVLVYNEYVVYDINQVRMKYLLRIKFHF